MVIDMLNPSPHTNQSSNAGDALETAPIDGLTGSASTIARVGVFGLRKRLELI